MDTIQPAIQLHKLSKQYRGSKTYALKHVSLAVNPSEVYGFLGANGAGKSTTIRCLLNLIQPSEGSATILGLDIVKDSVKIKEYVGYLAGDVALYGKMTGKQFLQYMTDLHPLRHREYLPKLVRDFDVDLNKPLNILSKGNRQKIGLLQALMHEPDLLILDEPTSGLDPLMQEVFFGAVKEAKQRGASIFLSSHNLSEVQRICDRIGFIRAGELVAERTLADLAKSASHTFDILFYDKAPLEALRRIPRAEISASITHDEHHATVILHGELSAFFGILAQHPVRHIDQREVNLEEEFLRLYEKEHL